MSEKRVFGIPRAFGGEDPVDETGKFVGRADPDFSGNTVYTDEAGAFAGYGTKDFRAAGITSGRTVPSPPSA